MRRLVRPGIDVLLAHDLDDVRGQRLGLLAGPGSITADLTPTLSALHAHPAAHLAALFAAEHGMYGEAAAGEPVGDGVDATTGLPVYSLYGAVREPTPDMLAGLDAIVIDLQDAGLRYYTFAATVHGILRAAARLGIPVVVLDRPAPLTGTILDGPLLCTGFRSFVGTAPTPIRHGLTLGELARLMNEHDALGADLHVVQMEGWRRDLWFDETGLAWAPPSPNLPAVQACLTYTATCLIEGTPLSEGRGTAQPFEILGAPWIDGRHLAAHLNGLDLPGVRFRPVWFRPSASKHAGSPCSGVQVHVVDRLRFEGVRTGLHLLTALWRLYPVQMEWITDGEGRPFVDLLLGDDRPRLAVEQGTPVEDIVASWQQELEAFAAARRPYLLYYPDTSDPRRSYAAHATSPLPATEERHPRTVAIDTLPALEILRIVNDEDMTVPVAVREQLPAIAAVVERVVAAFKAGGRLIYVGAGTSGRLGVLDAAECPPTFGTPPSQVQAVLAGGAAAMTTSVEGAEDDAAQGAAEMDTREVGPLDVVLGIAASGRTPFVVGALERARARGACTAALVGNRDGPVAVAADLVIAPQTGPEVITGSTRMKAGTAQKLVLNMISTAAMVLTGHTYGNLMVDVQRRNNKLRLRARRIVAQAAGVSPEAAAQTLAAAGDEIKTAIVMLLAHVDAPAARERLARAHGSVRAALTR